MTPANTQAGPSTVQVDFYDHGQFEKPIGSLAPGDSTEVLFDFPPGCFGPDCGFSITADAGLVVTESNENNNQVSGGCIG